MHFEARAEPLVTQVARRGAVGVGPRIELAHAKRPAVREPHRDHRVLDAAAAKAPQHAARIERGDSVPAKEDSAGGGRAVHATHERSGPAAGAELHGPAALEDLPDRALAVAETLAREPRVARRAGGGDALHDEPAHLAHARRARGGAQVTLKDGAAVSEAVALETRAVRARHERHEDLERRLAVERVVVA